MTSIGQAAAVVGPEVQALVIRFSYPINRSCLHLESNPLKTSFHLHGSWLSLGALKPQPHVVQRLFGPHRVTVRRSRVKFLAGVASIGFSQGGAFTARRIPLACGSRLRDSDCQDFDRPARRSCKKIAFTSGMDTVIALVSYPIRIRSRTKQKGHDDTHYYTIASAMKHGMAGPCITSIHKARSTAQHHTHDLSSLHPRLLYCVTMLASNLLGSQ
jgi:hypothetical protein